MSDLWRRIDVVVCSGGVCVSDLRPTRVSRKCILQTCQVRVSDKSVKLRVHHKSVR